MLAFFCNLIALILGSNSVKGLRIAKIVKEIKFVGIWSELGSKKGFQIQSFTKYLKLFFSSEIPHYGKLIISVFQEFFLMLTKVSFW